MTSSEQSANKREYGGMMSDDYRLRVDQRVLDAFPGYSVLVIYARGLTNGESDAISERELRAAEAEARASLGERKPAEHEHVAAWRGAFAAFGAKPSRYPCSVEALLSRVLKGQELPAINQIVDLYNAVSIRHVLPVGGEDLDRLTSDLTLAFADGTEPFDVVQGGEVTIEHPEPGEVVWADSTGVTCRRWNWRQGVRTRLTPDTRNAYFVLDRLAPWPLENLHAASDDLIRLLRAVSPDCEIETDLLGDS